MHPRYQEWLAYVFDHEVTKPQWYFAPNAPEFIGSNSDFALLIAQTFRRSGEDLRRFSDAQVNQGIWFLASPSCSNFFFSLRNGDASLEEKINGIHSIYDLYQKCFAGRCTETLGHMNEPGASDLNGICYMFWDVCPLSYLMEIPNQSELEEAVFSVLEQTLLIAHRACREGALHGLGEIACVSPQKVAEMVDRFLANNQIDDTLRSYATQARVGDVL